MTFLDELIHDRQSPIAVYHQFLLNNKPSIRCYHMFVEGDADYSFYTGFLLRFHVKHRIFIFVSVWR